MIRLYQYKYLLLLRCGTVTNRIIFPVRLAGNHFLEVEAKNVSERVSIKTKTFILTSTNVSLSDNTSISVLKE